MAAPNTPTGLAVSGLTSTGLVLSWADGGGGTVTFNLYGSPSEGPYVIIATLPVGTTSITLNSLSPSTAYSFEISGVNIDGESVLSAPVAAMTLGLTPVTTTPTLGLTFNDLILRVAEYLGVADYSGGVAAIPTDPHDLDLCKRLANDGYARFFAEKEWIFLNTTMTITPDGINYIFDLPTDFQGEGLTSWTYPITGPITETRQTTEQHIRAMRAGTNTTGYPTLFALQPKTPVDVTTNTARWQVIFWPTPYDNTLLLTSKYRRFGMALVNTTDRSVAGPLHDQTIMAAARAAAEIQRYGESGSQEQNYQTFLALSKRKDDASADNNIGSYGDRSDDGYCGRRRPRDQYRVDTYDGVNVLDVV